MSADHETYKSEYPVQFIPTEDIASDKAWEVHSSLAKFRFVMWGMKAGKTYMGAREFGRAVLASPACLAWIVSPTYLLLQSAERALLNVFVKSGVEFRRNRVSHEITLPQGQLIQGKSAEWPDGLLGPNVNIIWVDEAFFKDEAWDNLLSRIAATDGEILVTTTTRGRNFIWNECQNSGMPADAPYGTFEKGDYFVSHYPTWDFDWVPYSFIEARKRAMPRDRFEQDYGAKFISNAGAVFYKVEEAFTREPPPDEKEDEGPNVMGLDLAKFQDFTVPIIGNSRGFVRDIERWNKVEWTIQRARIIEKALRWNTVIVIDASQAGSVIVEDLRTEGLEVMAVELNSPDNKRSLIQALQLAFERGQIRIPHPRCSWAQPDIEQLYKELKWMEQSLTTGGKISFSAPRGLHDDCVIALALYNWGRLHGYAGGPPAADSALTDEDWQDRRRKFFMDMELDSGEIHLQRPHVFSKIFGHRKSLTGMESVGGRFWE